MKTFIKLLVVMVMLFAIPDYAKASDPIWYSNPATSPLKLKSWSQLTDLILDLQAYGLYDNGELKNFFTPQQGGFTETGTLKKKDGALYWHKQVSGSQSMDIWFKARIDGYTLYTDSPKEDIKWIKITKVVKIDNSYLIMTYDNRNTWRWFYVNYLGYCLMNPDTL